MKKLPYVLPPLILLILIAAATLAQANPPIVTPHDGADCGTDPYPAINSPDYRIDCYAAKPFDPTDPTWSKNADWIIVRSNDPHAQNQIHRITGTNLETNGAYGIDSESHVVNKGSNNAIRARKTMADNPNGGEGNDITADATYTESTASINPANPNENYGRITVLKPHAFMPVNGDYANDVRTLNPAYQWKTAYNVRPGSADIGLDLAGSKLVRHQRTYEITDNEGTTTYECNSKGKNCQRRKTEWHMLK